LLDPAGHAVALRDPDALNDPHLRAAGARSGLAAKVPAPRGGREFGTLAAFSGRPRRYVPEEGEFLRRAARLLGAALETVAVEEAFASYAARTRLLSAGAELQKVPAAPDALLEAAAAEAVIHEETPAAPGNPPTHPMADWCLADALIRDGLYPVLRRVAVARADAPGASSGAFAISIPLSPRARRGAPRAVRTRSPELVPNVDERFLEELQLPPAAARALRMTRPVSYACIPVVGEAKTHGVLSFLRCQDGTDLPYDPADLDALCSYVGLVAGAIDRIGDNGTTPELQVAEDPMRVGLNAPNREAQVELTAREEEILQLLSQGVSSEEIPGRLHITEATLKSHKTKIRRKAGYAGRNDLALLARLRALGWQPRRHL
jgi:DNA-binding CsgD family transcriptional regulator